MRPLVLIASLSCVTGTSALGGDALVRAQLAQCVELDLAGPLAGDAQLGGHGVRGARNSVAEAEAELDYTAPALGQRLQLLLQGAFLVAQRVGRVGGAGIG